MIAAPPDLLVIGGLTVDRFADGSSSPGGSVLHIARAAARRGVRVAVITVAGHEPGARAGIEELHGLAAAGERTTAEATATFAHRGDAAGRQLTLERRGGRIEVVGSALLGGAEAVLLAPVAGEMDADVPALLRPTAVRAAILQGWLRSLDEGMPVRPLTLGTLAPSLIEGLGGFNLLVASREDLLAEANDAPAQLAALRRVFGPRPALVVTDGTDGLWLDARLSGSDGPSTRHLPVPWRVDEVSTVGAGDVLAAFMTIGSRDSAVPLDQCAGDAMRIVAEILDERRG